MRKSGEMLARILAAMFVIGILFVCAVTKGHCQTSESIMVDRAQVQALVDQNSETKNTLAETMKRFWIVDDNLKTATVALEKWSGFARALKTVKTIDELDALCSRYQIPRDKAEPDKKDGKKSDGKEAAANPREAADPGKE